MGRLCNRSERLPCEALIIARRLSGAYRPRAAPVERSSKYGHKKRSWQSVPSGCHDLYPETRRPAVRLIVLIVRDGATLHFDFVPLRRTADIDETGRKFTENSSSLRPRIQRREPAATLVQSGARRGPVARCACGGAEPPVRGRKARGGTRRRRAARCAAAWRSHRAWMAAGVFPVMITLELFAGRGLTAGSGRVIAGPVADADLAEVIARRGLVDKTYGPKSDDQQCDEMRDSQHRSTFCNVVSGRPY